MKDKTNKQKTPKEIRRIGLLILIELDIIKI